MSISNFLQKQFSHYRRSAQKKETIQNVLQQEQQNIDVVNIHRYNPNNIGDFYCGPHHYFDELKGKHLDIFDYKRDDKNVRDNWSKQISNNALIIGGGGLLNLSGFEKQFQLFEELTNKGKKTIIWGSGHNNHNKSKFGKKINYNVDTSKFGLVGVREYGRKEEWVPCVSCLHPIFDNNIESTQEIGVVFHQKTLRNKKIQSKFSEFPSVSNKDSFEDVVRFIKKTEIILTDSYHAMYWGILLNKKVMVFPNSTKFYEFKYQPVISTFDNFKNDLNKLQNYSEAKEDCRTTNLNFANKVFDYLNL